MDVEEKGLNRLLLSPLYLYDQLVSTVMPGAVFLVLLCLKENPLMRTFWYGSPLGYRTKLTAFVALAFLAGHLVKLPLNFIFSVRNRIKKEDVDGFSEALKKQTPEVRTLFKGIVLQGAVLATPGALDRLSVSKADGGFYVGTGSALLLGALISGDGSRWRWWEVSIGLAMLWVGLWKAYEHRDRTLEAIGVGWANVLASATPQQLQLGAALIKL